ncbi:hypothetical protein KI387_007090, partial [Taxus chinensis]
TLLSSQSTELFPDFSYPQACAKGTVSDSLLTLEISGGKGMEGTFCVVGGDGFIGSSLVKSLLDKGFSVNATIFPTPGAPMELLL